jgi:hypothetical protein
MGDSLSGSQVAQPFLPLGFQPTRHHPVLRFYRAVLALGTVRLVARPFYGQAPLLQRGVVIGFQSPYRLLGNSTEAGVTAFRNASVTA